jgi:hypothetical protein
VPARTIVTPAWRSIDVRGLLALTRTVESTSLAMPSTSVLMVRSTPPGVGQ